MLGAKGCQSITHIHFEIHTCWYFNSGIKGKSHRLWNFWLWGSVKFKDLHIVASVSLIHFDSIVSELMCFLLTCNVKDYKRIRGNVTVRMPVKRPLYLWIYCLTAHECFVFVLSAWMLYFEERKCSLMLGVFLGVNLLHSCLRLWKEYLNIQRGCSARRRNIPQGCRRKTGSSRHLVMYWPQCKSISVILLMTWSMIHTVTGACFLLPPLAKCWQCLCVFSRPFMLLWVSWFVLFILNSWSGLAASW